jgi:hypothetical protein
MFVTIFGSEKCKNASILPEYGLVPSLLTTWPIKVILFAAKQHLFRFNFRLTSLSLKTQPPNVEDVPPNFHYVY